MEALLSLAFDNLSSYDGPKVKKGLKQIEGLLAQFCLSSPKGATPAKPQHASKPSDPGSPSPPRMMLAELSGDAAFREFFKLQEGFEWNVALRLVSTLDRLMARGADGQNDLLILNTLDLMQGLLLLHPPSKSLFSREIHMNVRRTLFLPFALFLFLFPSEQPLTLPRLQLLLDLVDPSNCPAIQCATLLTLVVALNDAPQNTRTFESLDGLLTITTLFKSRSTSREVKFRLVEFLYFYLLPETPSIPSARASATGNAAPGGLQRSPSKLAGAFARQGGSGGGRKKAAEDGATRTTTEKEALLGQHLHNVEDLVRDLREMTPFGGVVC